MRKHMYLITDHPDEDRVGEVIVADSPRMTTAEKNKEGVCQMRDRDTNETWMFNEVGLGYVDFDDEADYQENGLDAINRKLAEIDEEHLEKAGVDVEGVAA